MEQTIVALQGVDTLRWLADRGAKFCKVAAWDAGGDSRGKRPLDDAWQDKPYTFDQVRGHVAAGGNAGLLTGTHSGSLIILDIDERFTEFCEAFPWARTSPTLIRDGADKGKLIVKVAGTLPSSRSYRQPGARSPFFEVLIDGRQGVAAGTHPSGVPYQLINSSYEPLEFTAEQLALVVEDWTGETLEKIEPVAEMPHQTRTPYTSTSEGDGLRERVLERWPTMEIFKHHGLAGDPRRDKKDETRLLGNGGLMVREDGSWFCHSDQVGGHEFEAWSWCKTRKPNVPRDNGFYSMLLNMAAEGGVPLPERTNGRQHSDPPEVPDDWENSTPPGEEVITPPAGSRGPGSRDYLPFEEVRSCFERQEAGDAEIFKAIYAGRVVYDHSAGVWHIWKNHYWQPDNTRAIYNLVTNGTAAEYLHAAAEAQTSGKDELAKDMIKRAGALRTRKRADNVLFYAAGYPEIALTGEEWDRDPWLLGCENGVVDLRTGQLRPGRPTDYIRSHVPYDWAGIDAPCPTWEAFQKSVNDGRDDVMNFKARLFGYGITGLTTEHILPIAWGEGRNGKSTELETLGEVLGPDLATSSQADTLMDTNRGGDGPKPFVYALRGKRLVWASESNEGRRINSGLVKQLTGGDTLTVRTLHSKPVSFSPTHLVLLLTNNKPHMSAEDTALWDRVILMPYTLRFIDEPKATNERQRDKGLREKLSAERAGILAWLVRGCMAWQKEGLNVPEVLKAATREYHDEEDTLSQFEAERCIKSDLVEVRAMALYTEYCDWAKANGIEPMRNTAFGRRMKKRYAWRESHGIWYCKIGLLADDKAGR